MKISLHSHEVGDFHTLLWCIFILFNAKTSQCRLSKQKVYAIRWLTLARVILYAVKLFHPPVGDFKCNFLLQIFKAELSSYSIRNFYSMPQTFWNTENVSKWTSNVQLLCSTASTYWIMYPWLTSNQKISIWEHTRAKIHSFSKCQNSDHF